MTNRLSKMKQQSFASLSYAAKKRKTQNAKIVTSWEIGILCSLGSLWSNH